MGLLSRPDRRQSRRWRIDEIPGITGLRIESADASVINISTGGILFDCAYRLHPGARTALDILRTDTILRVAGRVVRSRVSALESNGVRYLVALAFEKELAAIAEAIENNERFRDPNAPRLQVEASGWGWVVDDMAALDLDPALDLNRW